MRPTSYAPHQLCASPAMRPTSHARYRPCTTLFNRQHEIQQLESFCMRNPTDILVVLGPRSCGKTAILKSTFAGKKNALYIDCRSIDASSPATFVYALIKELLPKVPVSAEQVAIRALSLIPALALQIVGGLSITGKVDATPSETINLAGLAKALLDKPIEAQKLQELNELFAALRCATCPCVLYLLLAWLHGPCCFCQSGKKMPLSCLLCVCRPPNWYCTCRLLFDAWEPFANNWPVIVIDYADKTMGWKNHPQELSTLLSFFVQITKQEGRCHVIMATSEYGYQAWLNDGRHWSDMSLVHAAHCNSLAPLTLVPRCPPSLQPLGQGSGHLRSLVTFMRAMHGSFWRRSCVKGTAASLWMTAHGPRSTRCGKHMLLLGTLCILPHHLLVCHVDVDSFAVLTGVRWQRWQFKAVGFAC